ncbi:hypothetical protein [Hymenobacter sp. YC55]|uniref:hypothetical protein n=1 Tax=Hymenobacter sp. YC55 TaxID=3034019 RepID=UPI0023F85978|nr:hypothetical protein [Hymenobacter sp. YC55]MDF7813272.1 hypothetical protein [Hymenobacter sp. YC55]
MRKALFLLALLLTTFWGVAQSSSAIEATVEVNRTHCLVRFVESIAGDGDAATRKAFEQSAFNTPAVQQTLRRYNQLDKDVTYTRTGYPSERLGSLGNSWGLYLTASAEAESLADLQRRAVGILPNEVLEDLRQVQQQLDPAFEALLWQPYQAELQKVKTAYADFLRDKKLLQHFVRLRTFYGSVWPDELPYRIMLNPLPGQGRFFSTRATVANNTVLLSCYPASRDFVFASALMFHEMSHSLSVQQRLALQQNLDRWYANNKSPNRKYAYYLMEEGLATAAGEWIYKQQTGQTETDNWYNDDYINRYAKAMYPLVERYIDTGRAIDSLFAASAIATFDATFPTATIDYTNLFRRVLYWTDSDDPDLTLIPFRETFNSTLSMTAAPIMKGEAALKVAQTGSYTPVIIITNHHAETLAYLRQQLPALRPHRLRPEKSFVLSTIGLNGPLLLINAHSAEQVGTAAQHLSQQKRIDPKHPLWFF